MPFEFIIGNRDAKQYRLSLKLQLSGQHPALFSTAPKCEQRLAYASGGCTRNLHNANKYCIVLLHIRYLLQVLTIIVKSC